MTDHTIMIVFRCHVPECEGNTSMGVASAEQWSGEWSSWALPAQARCERWQASAHVCHPDVFDNSSAVACDAYVYQHGSSIVSEVSIALYSMVNY